MRKDETQHSMFEDVWARISSARCIFVFIGSGLSAASGVPLYRDAAGNYIHPEMLAYTQRRTFEEDPGRMLAWYEARRAEIRRTWPNAGHYALAKLARYRPCVFATQNVDGLLEQALIHEDVEAEVLHLHGTLSRSYCDSCKARDYRERPWSLQNRCKTCGGLIRPSVVWFGESLPQGLIDTAIEAVTESSVCIIVGSSGMVYPAAELPEFAQERGLYVVDVNPHPSHFTDGVDAFLQGPAETILPALLAHGGL